jgi:hypothetical protein
LSVTGGTTSAPGGNGSTGSSQNGSGIGTGPPPTQYGPQVTYDQLDSEGQDFAAAINPQMSQLLQACAGVIEMMGQYTALINNAGQMYAETDYNSAFPPVTS